MSSLSTFWLKAREVMEGELAFLGMPKFVHAQWGQIFADTPNISE